MGSEDARSGFGSQTQFKFDLFDKFDKTTLLHYQAESSKMHAVERYSCKTKTRTIIIAEMYPDADLPIQMG